MERSAEGTHWVRFFERGSYPAEDVATFLKQGLDEGAFVMALIANEHEAKIIRALASLRVSSKERIQAGQLVIADARAVARALVRDGTTQRSVFDAQIAKPIRDGAKRHGRVVVHGEVVNSLLHLGRTEACLAVEALWNELLKAEPLRLCCAYALERFATVDSSSPFLQICDAHQHVECHAVPELEPGRLAAELWHRRAALDHEAAERRSAERDLAHAYEDLSRAYEATRNACQRADQASLAKQDFVARLGHEFRNPLSPILIATELMAQRAPEMFTEERTTIERQARHLLHLVNDLLDVSRIVTGRVELTRRPLELSRVVNDAVELVRPLLLERRQELSIDVAPNGLLVDGDQHRLAQVVVNLLSNAVKYTPNRGEIRIEAFRAGQTVTLSVSDDGQGLEQELKSRIFELFEQGPQSSARPQGGLGLGLAIAHNLVKHHGGRLHAFSDGPGRGSSFEVELPVSKTSAERPGLRSARPRPSRTLDVLVIDDNRDLATLFAESLRENGHRVEVALDGGAALKIAENFRPDIALLDLGLPDIDGCELGMRLKAEHSLSALKLVAISGYGQDADRKRTRDAGFDVHLVKPVPLADLEGVLASLFAEPQVA